MFSPLWKFHLFPRAKLEAVILTEMTDQEQRGELCVTWKQPIVAMEIVGKNRPWFVGTCVCWGGDQCSHLLLCFVCPPPSGSQSGSINRSCTWVHCSHFFMGDFNMISSLQTGKRWGFCHGRKPPLSTGAMLQRLDKWIVLLSCIFLHHTLSKAHWLETAIYDYNLYVSGMVRDWLSGTAFRSDSVSQPEINLRIGFIMTITPKLANLGSAHPRPLGLVN